jgi:hypothetical protein
MSALRNVTMKKVLGDWEEVYSVQEVTQENFPGQDRQFYKVEPEKYYQTFGGGPEGGYVAIDRGGPHDTLYKVRRGWGQTWQIEELENVFLEYEPADEMAGKTARCRLVEEYSLTDTREIVDRHRLWGNAIEIVKCLRDGLSPKADASYKDLCLGIILDHFKYIDKYLDLLPEDSCPRYKEVLHSFKNDEEDSEEESDTESEPDSEPEIHLVKKAVCEECEKPTDDLFQKCDGTEAQDVLFVCKGCEQKETTPPSVCISCKTNRGDLFPTANPSGAFICRTCSD